MRQVSLTHLGRSAALIIATVGDDGDDFLLTITRGDAAPGAASLRQDAVGGRTATRDRRAAAADAWFHDVHGSAPYKRHVTYYLAEQIRAELA